MKAFSAEFYNSTAWKNCRAAYMEKVGGLCEDCLSVGLYNRAEIVHHMIEVTPKTINNPKVTLNFDNLRALCRECHAKRHGARSQRRYSVDEYGHVVPHE